MTTRRPRSSNSQYTPRTGADGNTVRGVSASDYGRSTYGSKSAPRVASNAASAKRPAHTTDLAPRPTSDAAQYSRSSGNYGNGSHGNNGQRKNVKRRSVKEPRKRLNLSKGTKISIIVLVVLLAILIGGGIAFYKFISSVNDELVGGKSEEELLAIQDSLVARAR